MMTDIMFAKAHMGEYFQLNGHKVRVIGYDETGCEDGVIVDDMRGWDIRYIDPIDVIDESMCLTGRCMYAKWEDLK